MLVGDDADHFDPIGQAGRFGQDLAHVDLVQRRAIDVDMFEVDGPAQAEVRRQFDVIFAQFSFQPLGHARVGDDQLELAKDHIVVRDVDVAREIVRDVEVGGDQDAIARDRHGRCLTDDGRGRGKQRSEAQKGQGKVLVHGFSPVAGRHAGSLWFLTQISAFRLPPWVGANITRFQKNASTYLALHFLNLQRSGLC